MNPLTQSELPLEMRRTKLPDTMVKENVNLNLKAAYIHALGDLLQNVAVMVAAFIIWLRPSWSIADPICTLLFSIFVLFTTISILREAVNVLMEGTPIGVDLDQLSSDLNSIEGVCEVHDLHVWSLTVGKPALACHIVVDNAAVSDVLAATTSVCQMKYGILHTTIQTDFVCKTNACDTYAHQKCSL
ncbi:slc30a2 protein [Cardiosporidium cionae]|uniref:Slc30a2 protein n=1 Tax=Cardiosporidium cionae TaxID=476202 RepID=A0ABQ7J9U6_9APIC|nr:slc30a2 protein [Cardiosporidium cionae]|eukprot:KAF8820741.1 slc30a2 protein [Cardiosporidium cionae]